MAEDMDEAYRTVSRSINKMLEHGDAFVVGFSREHRTLQQKLGVVFLRCLEVVADNYLAGDYDLRNEAIGRKAAIAIGALREAEEPLAAPLI